jgi:hypothetical protein
VGKHIATGLTGDLSEDPKCVCRVMDAVVECFSDEAPPSNDLW